MRSIPILKVTLFLLALCLSGCGSLRTEFFRGETRYIYNNGCQQYMQGDYNTARKTFEKVLALDPDYGPAHGALGNLALIGAAYELALTHYQKAIQVDPDLEAGLRAFIAVATASAAREPLTKAGVDLNRVYLLMMADKQVELEALLSNDIPLDLLASDTLSITPSKLGELQLKAASTADPERGSARYRLFMAHLLFYGRTDSTLAVALVEQAAPHAKMADRQKAYVLLGQVYERRKDFNLAVDAYLAAVNAGLSVNAIAQHLARIYNVDIESVLSENKTPQPVPALPKTLKIEVSLPAPKPVWPKISFKRAAFEITPTPSRNKGANLGF